MQIEFQQPPEKLPTQMKLSKHGPPHTPPSYLYKQILPAKRSMNGLPIGFLHEINPRAAPEERLAGTPFKVVEPPF